MEPAGLALGIVGLVGVFTTCMDVLDRYDAYKEFGLEARNLTARFDGEKLRLRRWAEEMGIPNGEWKKSPNHWLQNPKNEMVVMTLMNSACEIFDATEHRRSKLRIYPGGDEDSSPEIAGISRQMSGFKLQRAPSASLKGGLGWALNHKRKFSAQVESFSKVVELLCAISPTTHPETKAQSNGN